MYIVLTSLGKTTTLKLVYYKLAGRTWPESNRQPTA